VKRTQMRAVSRKRRVRDAGYSAARRAVFDRADGRCEWCSAAPMSEVHHRAGRLGPDPHRLSNLAGLCSACHRRAHAEPAAALAAGVSKSRLANSGEWAAELADIGGADDLTDPARRV
jgi:5-methylcytosine-specific restriction endonuclease McrA